MNFDVREEPTEEAFSVPTHELLQEADGRATYVEGDVAEPERIGDAVEAARAYGGSTSR